MCGIAGQYAPTTSLSGQELCTQMHRMLDAIAHRGPDDSGVWVDEGANLVLGHRRLSIIDLSPTGHQPMVSEDGRYVLSYNGELYNFPELRDRLTASGHTFRGTSDTEILVHAIQEWGLEAATRAANGMFAFAVWDRDARTLSLVRDRVGKKPIYYGWTGGVFLFASELKALKVHPRFTGTVSRDALSSYMRTKCVPGALSIFEGIAKVEPGTIATFDFSRTTPEPPTQTRYWSLDEAASAGLATRFADSDPAAVLRELDALVRDAVAGRMLSDVPLGAFLSGGIDSSLVVAMMQAQSDKPIKTYTIGFDDKHFNEAEHARAVATHLGTDHTELYASPHDALDVIPDLPAIYDEPFADVSQIPTFLVTKLAREHVTVALSGDGGDEFFGGYGRYLFLHDLWKRTRHVPGPLRGIASSGMRTLRQGVDLVGPDTRRAFTPAALRRRVNTDRVAYLEELFALDDPLQFYNFSVGRWRQEPRIVRGERPYSWTSPTSPAMHDMHLLEQWMYLDQTGYLPNDILTKVDRASMAHSLEVRAPLLDYRVLEFAWRVPCSLKVRDGVGKWILRELAYQYVPREILDRPKRGFGVPMARWLRGELRGWAEELLNRRRLEEEGYFDVDAVRRRWKQHLEGARDWSPDLWNVLMFQAWLEEQEG